MSGHIMATLFIQHDVEDYDIWYAGYVGAEDLRKEHGYISKSLYRLEGSPNTIAAIHTFATRDQAAAFRDDPRLIERMHNIGVIGIPRVELYIEQE